VTVRVTVGPQGEQANGDSLAFSLSADAQYVAFGSYAFNLTPNDANDSIDVLVKDRSTGAVENITLLPANPNGLVSGDSLQPSISADGRYVAFLSSGNFENIPGANYSATPPIFRPFLYDRIGRTYTAVHPPNAYFNDHANGLALSGDGRYLAFGTTATNTGFAAGPGIQVLLCDFGPNRDQSTLTLVSHATASTTTPGNGSCNLWPGGISGDGGIVTFESVATNIAAGDAHAGPDVFFWRRSTGTVTLASPGSGPTRGSYAGGISADGSTIGFLTIDSTLSPQAGPASCRLYSVGTGQTRTISDPSQTVDYTPILLSGDGSRVVYEVQFPPLRFPFIYIEGVGSRILSQSTTGRTPALTVNGGILSADGRWAGWLTTVSTMAAGDTNGFQDVFLRGPF